MTVKVFRLWTIPLVFLGLTVVLSLSAGAQTPTQSADHTPCEIVDLMPLFWDFWAAAKDLHAPAQMRMFNEKLVKAHPEVYSQGVLGLGGSSNGLDDLESAFLKDAHADVPAMQQISAQIQQKFPAYVQNFRKAFPHFRCPNPIYFLVSLGAFDGAVRFVKGRPALLFGVDVISYVHDSGDLEAFFNHELFHRYHAQITGSAAGGMGDPLYVALWEEGLATYVSHVLDPDVSESKILGRPADLAQHAKPKLQKLAAEMLQEMDRWSPELYQRFFMGRKESEGDDLPPRSGYYLGFLVAQELGRGISLRDLAQMREEPLRVRIRATLEKMAANN